MNPATRRLISSSSIPRHVAARSRNASFIRRASLSTLPKNCALVSASNHSKACNSTLAEASTSSTPLPASLLKQPADNASEHHTKIFKEDSSTPIARYHQLVESGILRGDEHQHRIIGRLQRLHNQLLSYDPPTIPNPSESNSLLSRIFPFARSDIDAQAPPPNIPKGLYLYGDVGTGKTMLMDLFYQTLPSNMTRKRRVHFHAFMIDVHKRVHEAKKAMGYRGGDPILPVARDLANEACVLCFDEFQVTDIADAMILRRLLENLMKFGVVMVMTSNRHPDDLYKNGIQRSSFVPAIELIKSQIEVTDLNSGTDYRRVPRALSKVYYDPLSEQTDIAIRQIFDQFTSERSDPPIENRPLKIWGRTLLVPKSTSTVAWFEFDKLCGQPLSAADYIEVARVFETVFVVGIPKMGLSQKDMARRFITFIDACYESKTRLFVTSEVPVTQVFSDDASNDAAKPISDHMRSVMDDLGLTSHAVGSSSIFTGEEEVFAFARACSRLVQMGSKEWVEMAGQS
ncbi:AFG1 ATPase family protein [Pleurotus pulmonarius]|nr:hypothetical protein EYR36_006517 [Pleurotus pulmonarius]KAF4601217.1 hypothetical protein EYR38_005867 [Pleurotus pulmonarius]